MVVIKLFFRKLNKKKFIIKWNKKSFITENFNPQREKNTWFIKRNLRYGYSGNLIDKKIYGKIGFNNYSYKVNLLNKCVIIFDIYSIS